MAFRNSGSTKRRGLESPSLAHPWHECWTSAVSASRAGESEVADPGRIRRIAVRRGNAGATHRLNFARKQARRVVNSDCWPVPMSRHAEPSGATPLSMSDLHVVVLAAGKGTRMKSEF